MINIISHSIDLPGDRPATVGRHSTRGVFSRMVMGVVFVFLCCTTSLQAQTPVNDAFAGRFTIAGSTNTVVGNNSFATKEVGEQDHAASPAAASLWWTWMAPDSGPVVMTTLGSSFDTVLSVYTGTSLQNLALVADNDDGPGLATSALTFNAVRGTTYQIAVDGFGGDRGNVSLTVRLPVNPTAPQITSQPANVTTLEGAGSNVTFAAAVTGSFPLSFTWQINGVNLPGGTNGSYTVTNASGANVGDYRLIATNFSGSVTSSVAVLTVLLPAPNNNFSARIPISGQSYSTTTHNLGATRESGEPILAGVNSGASLWWTWTAPQNGLTIINTSGSKYFLDGVLDTVLAVYSGAALNSLTEVATNNDESGDIATSKVYFRAIQGVTYQIAASGLLDTNGSPATGNVKLSLTQLANNDFFANALEFPSGVGTVYDNLSGATIEPGEPVHAGILGGHSVWYYWVAPTNGTYVLHTGGSLADTILAIYTGLNINSLSLVAEDDNRGAEGASLVKFFAVGGTMYHFAVDGLLEAGITTAGAVALNLSASSILNDDFAERTTLSGLSIQVPDSNVNATRQPGEPNHGGNAGGHSIWWTWTAPITGPVVITTINSTFDTTLAVYTGAQVTALTLVAENDDAIGNPELSSQVQFQGIAGQTYQIAVDGYRFSENQVASGTMVLSIVQKAPPVLGGNDLFVNRFTLTGQTNVVNGSNTNASKEIGEPDHDGNGGGRSIWWSWVAPASSPVSISTFGSSFDTVLGVYQGTTVSSLNLIGADTRSVNGKSIVTFDAIAGLEYQIAVDGFNDGAGAASGRVVLQVLQFPAGRLHANDDFENSTPLTDFLSVVGLNIGATRQPGEPAHASTPRGHSLWWSWQAPSDGPVTISTARSQFDTVLAVYTGLSLELLSLVAENDDINPGNEQSSVTFQAVSNTVYHVAVDGYGNEIGLVNLTISPGADTPSAPQVQQGPVDQTRFSGGSGGGANVSFRIIATGSLPMTFQWALRGTNLVGATNISLTLTNATIQDAGIYEVIVSNRFGTATNNRAALTWIEVPFNDDFANRILITGPSSVARGSILGATKQPGELDHGGEVGGRSVWWKWIAPATGTVKVHTLGSSFDTVLAVYQGSDIANLTLIQENNDLLADTTYASKVLFHAVAGQEYQIAVDAAKTNALDGSVLLTVIQGEPPSIVTQPLGTNLIHFTNSIFALQVTASGPSPFLYQWFFNGMTLTNATNASYALGPLGREKSGNYSVSVANSFDTVPSSNFNVWVQVPQSVRTPIRSPNGHTQLLFSDPDGILSSDPARFEIQHTDDLSSIPMGWTSTSGSIVTSNGQFLFEDQSSMTVSNRFYRIIEK
jgi:hypothetical protein